MSTPKRTRDQLDAAGYGDEPEDSAVAPRPTPYPIEEAMEAALSGHDPATAPPHPSQPYQQDDWLTSPIATEATGAAKQSSRAAEHGQPGSRAADADAPATDAASSLPDSAASHPESRALVDAARSPADLLARADDADPPLLTPEEAMAPLQPWQRRFVAGLLHSGGIVALACRAANVSRGSAHRWRERDTLFAQLWDDALQHSTDLIEGSLYVSAVHGNLQPIYQGGILAGYKRVKDTKAAEILLKARRPEVYAPEQVVRIKGEAKVAVVSHQEVPAIVGDVIKALFAARAEQLEARKPVVDV